MVVRKFRQTTQHGAMAGKNQSKEVKFYNLDVIISVGYRVKSIQDTRFRQWATERLNESIVKGFTMDDERLKNLGGGNYWKELLDRIRACHEKINKKKENLAREIGTHIEKNACLFSQTNPFYIPNLEVSTSSCFLALYPPKR